MWITTVKPKARCTVGFPPTDFYAAVHYRCTGITHLTMMRRRGGPPELQMLSFCALPHLGVDGHFAP